MLVSALVARMLLREDRQPLPSELAAFWEPIERTDLCHYSFPANVEKMICAIGRLEQVPDFVGCGSCDETRSRMAREYFRNLCAWLRGRRSSLASQLGERSPVKEWLAACLAKTLKEHGGCGAACHRIERQKVQGNWAGRSGESKKFSIH